MARPRDFVLTLNPEFSEDKYFDKSRADTGKFGRTQDTANTRGPHEWRYLRRVLTGIVSVTLFTVQFSSTAS